MMLTSILTPNVEVYVATNPETATTSQGEIVNEALANLKEVTELYLEEIPMDSNGQPLFTSLDVGNDDRLRQVRLRR
jgi:predicted RNase H-like HicB family nuclease